jgi:hypothetical protein
MLEILTIVILTFALKTIYYCHTTLLQVMPIIYQYLESMTLPDRKLHQKRCIIRL